MFRSNMFVSLSIKRTISIRSVACSLDVWIKRTPLMSLASQYLLLSFHAFDDVKHHNIPRHEGDDDDEYDWWQCHWRWRWRWCIHYSYFISLKSSLLWLIVCLPWRCVGCRTRVFIDSAAIRPAIFWSVLFTDHFICRKEFIEVPHLWVRWQSSIM